MAGRGEILKNDHEIFLEQKAGKVILQDVSVMRLNYLLLRSHKNSNIYLKSTLFILVLNGTAEIEINFKKYEVASKDILLLSFGHFFKITKLSEDLECLSLYVSKDFVDEMYSTDMMYKRVKYGVQMYQAPVLHLRHTDFNVLKKRLFFIEDIIRTAHRYTKEMTLNALRIFLLDVSNIIENQRGGEEDITPSREEMYFEKFLNLLAQHYRSEHLVDFYAKAIHISPHHLTQIVKRLSGQTVSELVFQLLFSEAKQLLKHPKLSIQQVADELHFSDPSAFGKFFKRKSGVSPKAFRSQG